jgi:hypothetical protein
VDVTFISGTSRAGDVPGNKNICSTWNKLNPIICVIASRFAVLFYSTGMANALSSATKPAPALLFNSSKKRGDTCSKTEGSCVTQDLEVSGLEILFNVSVG